MDPHRFDAWTKAFVSETSRRTLLRGLLKAGAAAIGLAGATAQSARTTATQVLPIDCAERYEQCAKRQSFRQCARCANQVAALGCPVFGTPDFTFEQEICRCSSDAYCADGNSCTLDICSSNRCHNLAIGNTLADCTECNNDRQCPGGGPCCEGRCCPANTTCQINEQGIGICCEVCGDGQTCCQNIEYDGGPNGSVGYALQLATCVGQEGAECGLPTFCCNGSAGGYDLNPDCSYSVECHAPVGSLP